MCPVSIKQATIEGDAISSEFQEAGDLVYLLGETKGEPAPGAEIERFLPLYPALARAISGHIVRSVHDGSDNGFAAALPEPCMGARQTATGIVVNPGCFIVSVRAADRERFESTMRGTVFKLVGEICAELPPVITDSGSGAVENKLFQALDIHPS